MFFESETFGQLPSGEPISLFSIRNQQGMSLRLTDFGAIVVGVDLPRPSGGTDNVTLGFPNLAGYLERHPSFGSTVGRFANRIANGRFTIDGQVYQLATNNGPHHLHGGVNGFDRFLWQAEPVTSEFARGVRFSRLSPDGEEAYPGNLQVHVTYSLTEQNEVHMEYEASTDKPTIVNLTNHNYWNLTGTSAGPATDPIFAHELQIEAEAYLPVNEGFIPSGTPAEVAGTPLDFRSTKTIGRDFSQVGGTPPGYDHCYVLRSQNGTLAKAA